MRLHVGTLPVDLNRAESARFRHPLLFLHGLWTGSWIWAGFGAYLAHRGWESFAPSLAEAPPIDLAGAVDVVAALGPTLPAPPIILAHGTGVVLAAALADRLAARAVVALAPTTATTSRALFGRASRWRMWFGGGSRVPPPKAFAAAAGDYAAGLRPDEAILYRTVAASDLPRVGVPGLVVSSERDRLVLPTAVAVLAAHAGFEHRVWPAAGHFALIESGWERRADDVHRWIVRTVGETLLAFLDEEH